MRRLAGLVLLGLLVLPSVASAIDDALLGALKRVEAVRIEGNRAIKDGAIKKVIKTGAGSFLGLRSPPLFRPDFLRSDAVTIQNLYIRKGFLDASVSARADSGDAPGRVIVTYTVHESTQVWVRAILFEPTDEVTFDELRRVTKQGVGEPYDPVQFALDRAALAQRFADDGYFPAITTRVARFGSAVELQYIVVRGPAYAVRDVAIAGLSAVDTAVVRREILFRPGDRFRRPRLIKSSERLYDTALFNSAEIEPVLADTVLGVLDLKVRVRERKPRWVEGGIGSGNSDRVRVSGQWGHRNLWGAGRSLTTGLSFGYLDPNRWRAHAEVAYTEPWVLGLRLKGQIKPLYDRTFQELGDHTFITSGFQLSSALVRDFPFARSQVSLSVDNAWARIEQRTTGTDSLEGVTTPYIRRWTLAFDQDVRDDRLDPRAGSLSRLAVQLAGSQSENEGPYFKFEAMRGVHVPNPGGGSFGVRLRAGLIASLGPGPKADEVLARVRPTERFYVGGSSSVRGYHENGIDGGSEGGRMLLNANFEWRIPVKGILSTALFLDGGNVWARLGDVRAQRLVRANGADGTYGAADMHWSVGTGLRVRTPIGPLRLDYAYRLRADESDLLAGRRLDRGGPSFSIGQIF
jgi:outer membrane protein assembly complex protein YaeT